MDELVINGVTYVKKQESAPSELTLVRTNNAGVHFGELVSAEKGIVVLKNAKRIWRWRGANTLNEAATHGVDEEYTRISEAVSSVTLLDAIEMMPITFAAALTLESRWPE